MKTLGNNGNQLADLMNNDGKLLDGLTIEQCDSIAREHYATTEQQQRWLNRDDFWEDFAYRSEELGIKLAY